MKKALLWVVFALMIPVTLAWAGSYTPNKNFYKPTAGESGWATLMNSNWDNLDGLFLFSSIGSKPTASCAAGTAIGKWDLQAGTVTCVTASSSGSGSVTSVSSANGDITVSGGTGTAVMTLNSGVGANKIVKQGSDGKLPAIDATNLLGVALVSDKSTNTNLGTSDTLYPSQNAAKTYTDTALASKVSASTGFSGEGVYCNRFGVDGICDSWDQDFSNNSFIPMVILSTSSACVNNQLATFSTGTSGQRIYSCEAGSWKLQGGTSGGGVISGVTGSSGDILTADGAGGVAVSPAKVTPIGLDLGKANGGMDWIVLNEDYGTDSYTGVFLVGPTSSATMTSYAIQFSATAPNDGDLVTFATTSNVYIPLISKTLPGYKLVSASSNLKQDALMFALLSTTSGTIDVQAPWSGTITSADIVCQQTSTISVAFGTAVPGSSPSFSSISASAPVAITSAIGAATNSTLTGWTKTVTAGNWYRATAPGMTGGPCSVSLRLTKSN